MNQPNGGPVIQVRVEQAAQLFDSLDPFPFQERDLDRHAEEFIVGWARELAKDAPIRIVMHLPRAEAATPLAAELETALTRYFGYRADMIARDLRELFRLGWRSLAIGLVALAVCLTLSQTLAAAIGTGQLSRFVQESLIILGWVANWRPIEIFLYDWWPIRGRRDLYRRLAAATVEISPY
jgi:hypothetical protein